MQKKIFSKFLKKFPPSDNLVKPTEEMLEWYADKLPEKLLCFWKEYGFGNYANGLIKVIEPSDYIDNFYTWIGGENFNKLPILLTAFGDLFYYRKLSETENDISLLNIHYRKIDVCTYNFDDFFDNYIIDDEISEDLLKEKLFAEAVELKGNINFDEIFFFVPALIFGGSETIKYLDKGSANIHQQILFQMGN